MERDFDVVIERDNKTRQFYASVPALPGCYSYADTIDELLKSIREAIEVHLEVMHENRLSAEEANVLGMFKVTV